MPKSSRKPESAAGAHLPPLVDPRLGKAISNVLRQHILVAAVQGEVSAKGLSETLEEDLTQIAYHMKVLRRDCGGLLRGTRHRQVRGAVERFYRADSKALVSARGWRQLGGKIRTVVGGGAANDLLNDVAKAVDAGKLQGPNDVLYRAPLTLDEEGQRNVKGISDRAIAEVEEEQQAAAERMARQNGSGAPPTGHVFSLMAFEAAWQPPAAAHTPSRRSSAPERLH